MALAYRTAADAAHAKRFFARRPEARRTWEAVAQAAVAWGAELVATKSRVALLARTRFAWCPQALASGAILVRCILPAPIESPRVRNDAMPDGRWSVRIRIEEPDPEALAWIEAAYRFDTA